MQKAEDTTSVARFISDLRRRAILPRDEELKLVRKARAGDTAARDTLIESNIAYVISVAHRYRNCGLPFEDLINEGNIGLIEAAERYDHTKGTKFITCANWWIQKRILLALERSNLIRIPYSQKRRVREIRASEQHLSVSLGRRPERAEVSERLDRCPIKVEAAMQIPTVSCSIDTNHGDDESASLSEFLIDESGVTPEESLIQQDTVQYVTAALDSLTEIQRQVLVQRFGLDGEPPRILQEVGDRLGVSRERVRQIEVQAMDRLRRVMARRSRPLGPPAPAESFRIA